MLQQFLRLEFPCYLIYSLFIICLPIVKQEKRHNMWLFSVFFAVMETSTDQSGPRCDARTPPVDEDMSKIVPITNLASAEEEVGPCGQQLP
jgi:hypothetical protein